MMLPPMHPTIVEPFAGSACYSIRYGLGKKVILVEKDPIIASVWEFLIHATPRAILRLPDIPNRKTIDDFALSPGEAAFIGFWLNRGSAQPSKSPSKWMRSKVNAKSTWWGREVRARVARLVDGLRGWTIAEGDYTRARNRRATWIIDPPYQKKGKYYKFGSDKINYEELAEWCRERRGQVMVCENRGANWLPFKSFAKIKANSSSGDTSYSKEVLWTQTSK